jgi:hypothetical protein
VLDPAPPPSSVRFLKFQYQAQSNILHHGYRTDFLPMIRTLTESLEEEDAEAGEISCLVWKSLMPYVCRHTHCKLTTYMQHAHFTHTQTCTLQAIHTHTSITLSACCMMVTHTTSTMNVRIHAPQCRGCEHACMHFMWMRGCMQCATCLFVWCVSIQQIFMLGGGGFCASALFVAKLSYPIECKIVFIYILLKVKIW